MMIILQVYLKWVWHTEGNTQCATLATHWGGRSPVHTQYTKVGWIKLAFMTGGFGVCNFTWKLFWCRTLFIKILLKNICYFQILNKNSIYIKKNLSNDFLILKVAFCKQKWKVTEILVQDGVLWPYNTPGKSSFPIIPSMYLMNANLVNIWGPEAQTYNISLGIMKCNTFSPALSGCAEWTGKKKSEGLYIWG